MSELPAPHVLLAAPHGSVATPASAALRELVAASAPGAVIGSPADPSSPGAAYDCIICHGAQPDALTELVSELRARWQTPIIAICDGSDETREALRKAGATATVSDDELTPSRFAERLALAVRLGRAEARAARAVADLLEARRARNDFVRLVSHDLRGPLSTIHLACDALRPQIGDGPGKAYLAAAERGVERARNLLDGQLDVAGLESGSVVPNRIPTSIGALLERVRATYAARAAQARCALRVIVPEAPLEVALDPSLVERALGVLMGGAIARAPGGELTIRGVMQRHELLLEVRDDGVEIAPSQLGHLFDQAWHGPRGDGRLELGAALVKAVAEAHGGRVAVVSEPTAGTRIELRLPR